MENHHRYNQREWWIGSHYELCCFFHKSEISTNNRLAIFKSFWSIPNIVGIVHTIEDLGEKWEQKREQDQEDRHDCYGYIDINGYQYALRSVFLTYGEVVIFLMYIPLTILSTRYHIQYPLQHRDNPWMNEVNTALSMIGVVIYQAQPFVLAAIGEEASASQLDYFLQNLAHESNVLVPETLFKERHIPTYGKKIADDLWWTK